MSESLKYISPETQVVPQSSRDYSAMLTKLEFLDKSGNEASKEEFINERLQELESTSEPKRISLPFNNKHFGFIHPKSEVKRSMMVDGFLLDDSEVYKTFLDALTELQNNPSWKDVSLRQMMSMAIQYGIGKYFGNITATANTENRNRQFYMDHSSADSDPISIKDFKDKKMGVCAEKAAVAQNLLSFVGIDSYLINSSKCKFVSGDEAHAYNLLATEKGYFIYDPTNPHLSINKETDQIINYGPAIYPISEEQFNSIKNGGTVEVEHSDEYQGPTGRVEREITKRVYGG